VVQKKIAQSLMQRHFATVCSRMTRFHQNSQKLTGNTRTGKFWILRLNILCLAAGNGTI